MPIDVVCRARHTVRMPVALSTQVLKCRVPDALKRQFCEYARSRSVRPSEALRELLEQVLVSTAEPVPDVGPSANRVCRVRIRLSARDWSLISARAKARGVSAADYIRSLCVKHVRSVHKLPAQELAEVHRLLSEIVSLREALDALGSGQGPVDTQVLRGVSETVGSVRCVVVELLRRNAESWEA